MMNVPLADASGAVVISKKKFESLPADLQEILLRTGKKFMRELTLKSRTENALAIETLKKTGVQITEVKDKKLILEYGAAGKKARQALVGKLYDQSFLDRVEKSIADFRTKRNAGK